jgi:protein phosphatase methylesterase 1
MSEMLLAAKVPKILILATNERLDKTLQMAIPLGKLKTILVEDVGHSIQEDNPHRVA